MKKSALTRWLVLAGITFGMTTGCRKSDDPVITVNNNNTPTDTAATLQLRFAPVVNGTALEMDSVWYSNASGDSFRITNYQYYVSNFTLETEEGTTIKLPETYLLISGRELQLRQIPNVPLGNYRKISFLLGVDSARNVSGAQSGDLDQTKGMFWDWDAGYIMAKLEGNSPQSANVGGDFIYHIVGFSGTNSVLRTVSLPTSLKLEAGKTPTLTIQSDVASWFSGTSSISIRDVSNLMSPGKQAGRFADNYAKGFSVVRVDP